MRALVTGATGFAGSYLTVALHETGWRVTPFRGDICRPDSVRRFRGDAVIHLAAQANVTASRQKPLETFEVNTLGTLRLLEALSGFHGRILIVSTADLYRPHPKPRRETDPVQPRNPYGWSKLFAENVARTHDELDIVIARPFNHTGPRQRRGYVCADFAAHVAAGKVSPSGSLDAVKDFLDVRDVVRAYLALITKGHRGEIYNIASGCGWKIRAILETMIRLHNRPMRVHINHQPTHPPHILIGDASKLRRHTGWSPRIPFEQTLADLLAAQSSDL